MCIRDSPYAYPIRLPATITITLTITPHTITRTITVCTNRSFYFCPWLQHQANEMCGSGWLYLDGGAAFLVNSVNERNEWGLQGRFVFNGWLASIPLYKCYVREGLTPTVPGVWSYVDGKMLYWCMSRPTRPRAGMFVHVGDHLCITQGGQSVCRQVC